MGLNNNWWLFSLLWW